MKYNARITQPLLFLEARCSLSQYGRFSGSPLAPNAFPFTLVNSGDRFVGVYKRGLQLQVQLRIYIGFPYVEALKCFNSQINS